MHADTKEPFHRGDGYVEFQVTEEGEKILGVSGNISNVTYADGPMLIETNEANYQVLARFTTSVNPKLATMVGEPAVAVTTHGKGKVLIAVPHAELSIGDGSLGTPELLKYMQGIVGYVTPTRRQSLYL